jgi:isocitrate/isopropylmalate dehydrogenase
MPNARRRIALLPGDGIGQEVVPAAQQALQAAGFAAEYVLLDAGFATFQRTGNALPPEMLAAARACDGALFGAVSSPSTHTPGYASPILTLRKELDLYANIRQMLASGGDDQHPDDVVFGVQALGTQGHSSLAAYAPPVMPPR